MPRAICEDCGSLVEAELTHNGICAVGHYVHCGWGHELSPDDLISDDVAQIIADLEAKLAKVVAAAGKMLDAFCVHEDSHQSAAYEAMCAALAETERESHE